MKIVVNGGTGLIGSKTVERLRRAGHEVVAGSPQTGLNSSPERDWMRRSMERKSSLTSRTPRRSKTNRPSTSSASRPET